MTVAIIQARLTSTRLPRKVLLPLEAETVLHFTYSQAKKSSSLDLVVIATSHDATDDELANYCTEKNLPVFRGSLSNVLERYYECAKHYQADTVVRITADCPLVDPAVIDQVVMEFKSKAVEYASNSRPIHTYPNGIELEVFSFHALEKAYQEATKPSEKEHVTPYIWNHPELFSLHSVQAKQDFSSFRVTLDKAEDYVVISVIVRALREKNVTVENVISFLQDHPEVRAINAHIMRDEGYQKSLREDRG